MAARVGSCVKTLGNRPGILPIGSSRVWAADGGARAVDVVLVNPDGEHDPDLGERGVLLAVQELAPCEGVERLDEADLPRTSPYRRKGSRWREGGTVAQGPGIELRAIIRADATWAPYSVTAWALMQRATLMRHVREIRLAGTPVQSVQLANTNGTNILFIFQREMGKGKAPIFEKAIFRSLSEARVDDTQNVWKLSVEKARTEGQSGYPDPPDRLKGSSR